MRQAGLPKCRLHDCRHSTNSLLEKLGVPDSVRARWFGHTVAVNTGTYTHVSAADLGVISDALGELFQGRCVKSVTKPVLPGHLRTRDNWMSRALACGNVGGLTTELCDLRLRCSVVACFPG